MNLRSTQLLFFLIAHFIVSGQPLEDPSFFKITKLKNELCSTNLVIYPGNGILNFQDSSINTGVQLIRLLDNNGIIQLQSSKCASLRIYSYMALLAKKLPIADRFRDILNRDTSKVNFLDGCIMIATTIKQLVSTISMLQVRENLKNNITGMPQGITKYKLEEGIQFEVLDSQNTDQNRFTKDNKLYPAYKELTYSYSYKKEGRNYLCELTSTDNSNYNKEWRFVPIEKKTTGSITKILLKVKYGLQGFDKMLPGYSQTIIEYNYLTDTYILPNSEQTGLVENKMNIWFHPPRMMLFKILELNPFPFIQLPPRLNNSWNWELNIGEVYADARWKNWSGIIKNKYSYKTKKITKVKSVFGTLDCFEIVAEANSELGKTSLTSYFNEEYGFVKMIYSNIDSSILTLNLISIENKNSINNVSISNRQ